MNGYGSACIDILVSKDSHVDPASRPLPPPVLPGSCPLSPSTFWWRWENKQSGDFNTMITHLRKFFLPFMFMIFLLLKSCTTVLTCEVGWKLWVDSGLCIVWYHTYPDYHITCYQNWSTNRRLTAQTVYLSSLSATWTHDKRVKLVVLRSKSYCYIWCHNHYFFGLFP